MLCFISFQWSEIITVSLLVMTYNKVHCSIYYIRYINHHYSWYFFSMRPWRSVSYINKEFSDRLMLQINDHGIKPYKENVSCWNDCRVIKRIKDNVKIFTCLIHLYTNSINIILVIKLITSTGIICYFNSPLIIIHVKYIWNTFI